MAGVAHFDFAQKLQFMLGAFKYFSQTVSRERSLAVIPSGRTDVFFFLVGLKSRGAFSESVYF